jgi:hypothetical protein
MRARSRRTGQVLVVGWMLQGGRSDGFWCDVAQGVDVADEVFDDPSRIVVGGQREEAVSCPAQIWLRDRHPLRSGRATTGDLRKVLGGVRRQAAPPDRGGVEVTLRIDVVHRRAEGEVLVDRRSPF